jgi:hypothetical protein
MSWKISVIKLAAQFGLPFLQKWLQKKTEEKPVDKTE